MRGPLDRLEIAASLDGKGLAAGPLSFPGRHRRGARSAHPPARDLDGLGRGRARAHRRSHHRANRRAARAFTTSICRPSAASVSLSGKVKTIAVSDDRVDLEDIAVERRRRDDSPRSVGISPTELRVRASAEDLDLKKLAAVLAPTLPVAGRLSFDVDADLEGRHRTRSRANAALRRDDRRFFGHFRARRSATSHGRRFSGGAEVRAGDLGTLSARTVDATLGRSAPQGLVLGERLGAARSRRCRSISRRLVQDTARRCSFRRSTPEVGSSPSSSSRAKSSTFTRNTPVGERSAARRRPHRVDRSASPRRGRSERFRTEAPPRLTLAGSRCAARRAPRRGRRSRARSPRASSMPRGSSPGSRRSATFRSQDLLPHPREIGTRLLDLPFTAKLTLPSRPSTSTPSCSGRRIYVGQVEVHRLADGIDSQADARARRSRARHHAREPEASPSRSMSTRKVSYDGQQGFGAPPGDAARRGRSRRAHRSRSSRSTRSCRPIRARCAGKRTARPSSPISRSPASSSLVGSQLDGLASGNLRWDGVNRDPDVQGQIDVKNLQVDRATFPHAVGVLRIAKGGVVASASLDQKIGRRFGDGDGARAMELARSSRSSTRKSRSTSTSRPRTFAPRCSTRVLFRTDLHVLRRSPERHAPLPPGRRSKASSPRAVDGSFDLRDGVFQIPEVGQEFRNASATILDHQAGRGRRDERVGQRLRAGGSRRRAR